MRTSRGDCWHMTRDECLEKLHSLATWEDDRDALVQMERDVHAHLASFEDRIEKVSALNDLCKAFKDQAPDTTRTSLMLAGLEGIFTKMGKGDTR